MRIVQSREELLECLTGRFKLIHDAPETKLARVPPDISFAAIADEATGTLHRYAPTSTTKAEDSTQKVKDGRKVMTAAFYEQDELPCDFLDLENHTRDRFVPREVEEADLVLNIMRKKSRAGRQNAGRDDAKAGEARPEWLLASHGPVMSSFHIDAAGACTATTILIGAKYWLVPKGDPAINREYRGLHQSHFSRFPGGASAIKLEASAVM